MIVLLRSLNILSTCCRYRLDQLIDQPLPLPLRLLFNCFSTKGKSRGERLRLACEELGPIFVKFGQMLSTRPDLIAPDIVDQLNQLQDNVPPFSPAIFREIVENSLEEPIDDIFKHFEQEPLASASVAQVHAAVLNNGQEVVVKAIRPGIEHTIAKDIALLLWIARTLERWLALGRRLHPVEIVEDYRDTIFDELDLQREAANASQLRRHFEHSALLYVPRIIWDYSSSHILVMERIYGIPISDIEALKAQQTNMPRLAERGVEIFFKQVFENNFFHADMHPGNIFVSKKNPQQPQYICVDMAIVGSLTREDQYYLARNLLAMFRRDYRQVAELHVQSGWVPKETRISDFEAAVRTVCEPIFQKPIAEISFGKVLISLFQTAQRFNMEVQPQLVLLQKTLLNIEGLGRQLYPELDLWETAHPFLERWLKQRFHPKTLLTEFKRYAPEWMEKFPEIPMKVYRNLETLEAVGEMTPQLLSMAHNHKEQQQRQKRKRTIHRIAIATGIATAISAWPLLSTQLNNVSWLPISLGVVTIGLWLLR